MLKLFGTRLRVRSRAGDREALARALAEAKVWFGLAAAATVRSCYEAGRDGFWPARLLTTLGVENLVVDSSSIEVPRRARRTKTDRLDGEKLPRRCSVPVRLDPPEPASSRQLLK